ncbi:TPA: SUMO protein smt3 [Trebouxia sp. C0004]
MHAAANQQRLPCGNRSIVQSCNMGADEAADTGAEVKPDIAGTRHGSYQVRSSTPFEKMFVAYRSRFHLAEQDIRFVVNGTRVKPFHTPQEHELEDGDEVEVILDWLGGW